MIGTRILTLHRPTTREFFIQYEPSGSGGERTVEPVGHDRAFEFYWNAPMKVDVDIDYLFKDAGVMDG